MIRHFRLPNHRIASRLGATVTIRPWQDQFIVSVRPWRTRRVYSLPLASVAAMLCDRVARNEAQYARAARRKA